GLHGGEEKALVALLVFLGELSLQAFAEGFVLVLEGAHRGRDLRDAVFGQPRGLAERLGGIGFRALRRRRGALFGRGRGLRGGAWRALVQPRTFAHALVMLAACTAGREVLLLVPLEGGRSATAGIRRRELLFRIALLGARARSGPGFRGVAATIRRLELGLGHS